MLRKSILGVICALTLASCYEEPKTIPSTKLIEGGTWRRVKWTSTPPYQYTFNDGTRGIYSNLFDLYQPCRHDDEYKFKLDDSPLGGFGTYIYQEGKLSCGSNNIMEAGDWFIAETSSGIHFYFEHSDSEPGNYNIVKIFKLEELTQNTLVFTYELNTGHKWREEYIRE